MFSKIFNIGIHDNLKESVANKVRVTNRIAFLFAILCLVYFVISILINKPLVAKSISVIILCQVVIIFLNYLHLVNLSRIALSCVNTFVVYLLNNLMGPESGVYMVYCAVFLGPIVRFNLNESWQIYVSYLFIVFTVLFDLYFDFHLYESPYSIEAQKEFFPYILPLTIAIILINGIAIIRELKSIELKAISLEKKVLSQNAFLIKSNNRLQENENDLKLIVSLLNDSVLLFDKEFKLIKQWGLNITHSKHHLSNYFSNDNVEIIRAKVEAASLNETKESFELTENEGEQYFRCVLSKTSKDRYVLCTTDITERHLMKIEAEKRKELLENVVNNIPIDIVLFDEEHKYRLVNEVAIKNPEVRNWIIGKDDFDYCKAYNKPVSIAEKRRAEFNKVIDGQAPLEWEEELESSNGSKFILRKMSPIVHQGVVEYIIGFAIDITKIKMAEKKLLHAKNIAVENARHKSQFLSTMSHEIRTPLNAIIGLSHLLLNHNLKGESKDYVNSLHFSAKNLLNLINDILDYNKIESGNLILEKRTFIPLYFLEQLVAQHKHGAAERGNHIELSTPDNLPNAVLGDESRLAQVINNLLSNAVKFTKNGTIGLKVMYEHIGDRQCRLHFEVSDTGIGIKEENQEKVFQSFMQENASITRKYGGTGLGLAICKSLVALMGGQLQLESTHKVGTQFFFAIDFELKATSVQAPPPKLDKLPTDKTVLLVEDNQMNALIAEKFLNEWGILQIDFAKNGQIGVEKCNEKEYDLILMDLQMPVMDGYTASRTLRAQNVETPIIALTAEALSDVKEKIYESGMNAYISKPFNPKNLFNTLCTYLNSDHL